VNSVVSVNVGLPRDVEWQSKLVRTAIWKKSVPGRVMARRLNLDGDGQGDLAGRGGEHRAVMVYQGLVTEGLPAIEYKRGNILPVSSFLSPAFPAGALCRWFS
jgi:MOSC domain-containing protein YiiM